MEETRRIFGISADPVIKKAYVWKNSMAQFTINHRVKISSICDQLKFHRGLFLTGSAYRATGISDCIHEAELTAEQVIRYLSRSIHEIFDGFVRG
jgi:oxygen-dependent protoporphyrinogen oxidase